ncbi:MAG TPA: inner membrane protein YiaA [Chitinophagaceae bacterium]|nr:inner membrane protein YiaA [Chitinophagaceae bacterium]
MKSKQLQPPSPAFIAASWLAFLIGFIGFITGLWNAEMELNEKGYYFTVLVFGLFAAISVQKAVRDQIEGIPVTSLYYGIAWFSTVLSILLLTVGLWNADLIKSEKGFYAMAFVLSLFGVIAIQKNTRDLKMFDDPDTHSKIPQGGD